MVYRCLQKKYMTCMLCITYPNVMYFFILKYDKNVSYMKL